MPRDIAKIVEFQFILKLCCTVLAQTAIFGDIAWDSAKYNGYVADICGSLDHSRQVCKERRVVQTCSACPTNIYQAALDVRVRIEFAQFPIIMRCRFLAAAEEEGDYHLNGPSVSCFVASLASRSSMAGLSARMAAQPWTLESERVGACSENAKRTASCSNCR